MKKALAFILLASIANAANTGGVEGTVVDASTGKIVPNARVTIQCGSVHKSVSADSAGRFSIGELPEGACNMTINGSGYGSSMLGVTVSTGSIATLLVNVTSLVELRRQAEQQAQWQKEMRTRRVRVMGAAGGRPVPADVMVEDAPMPAAPAAMEAPRPAPMAHHAPPPPPPKAPPPMQQPVAKAEHALKQDVAGKVAKDKNAELGRFRGDLRERDEKRPIVIGGEMVNGWSTVRVFPVPQYTRGYEGPRDDFRETIYWNPSVETDGNGNATVKFATSDAVTSFRATAEGFAANGTPGTGTTTFKNQTPMSIDAHLPTEVTQGDAIRLPITVANDTDDAIDAKLSASFGKTFELKTALPEHVHLAAHTKQSVFAELAVVATEGDAKVKIGVRGGGVSDDLERTIRVVPKGFPFQITGSGTAKSDKGATNTFTIANALPGTMHATLTMYPSPVAAMTQGMESMIREPGGCFEQTSSTNYPNIMVLAYLGANDKADQKLVASAKEKLDHGYKLLTGYETPEKGYEWFGHTPGHEALTAYGLMEFADMSKVYTVDSSMVERTAAWLNSRRDHKGGFMRSQEALDSFGRAGEETTNAYIMWALSEAHRTSGMQQELGVQAKLAATTSDPYLLSLAANTAVLNNGDKGVVARLARLQGKDGGFAGAKESITMSGGESLNVETTSLAMLAMIKASPNNEFEGNIRAAADYLNSKRSGGGWGNTQSTILGLKAMTAYSEHARQMATGGAATLIVNGKDAGKISFEKGRREALVWSDFADKLVQGKNTIEVKMEGGASLPYAVQVDYRSAQPQSSTHAKIALSTQLLKAATKMGDAVTLRAHVENTTNQGQPMTLARIGLPGGTVFQTWQLKELKDKGLVDFYETRPREVILYWRAMAPGAKKDIDINLLSSVPGAYEAPASSAYLYYTAEDKSWAKPVDIAIKE